MQRIGLIVAVEMDALTRRYGAPSEVLSVPGYDIQVYRVGSYQIYAVKTGAGQIRAAAGTQLLITLCQVDAIFNFGVVGGLTPSMRSHRSCLVERVVHYQFDTSAADHCQIGHYDGYPDRFLRTDSALLTKAQALLPEVPLVTCASGDKFVADPDEKRMLHETFQADICEMEAAAIVLICDRNQIPCLMLKLVVDSIDGGADEYWDAFNETSDASMALMDRIFQG